MAGVKPIVSFLIATYNRADFLERCIGSIFSQTVKDCEIIVVDDCSTDNTEELIRGKYAGRVTYHRNYINRGVAFSRNVALDYASGTYLGFLDSDDILYSREYLGTALAVFKDNPDIDIFCCDAFCIDEKGDKISEQTFLRTTIDYRGVELSSGTIDFDTMFFHGIHSCGALVRKGIIKKTGFLNLDYKIAWDEDFFLRVLTHKPRAIYYCNRPLTGYRQHNSGNLSNNTPLLYLERIRCRREVLNKNKSLKKRLGYKVNRRFAEQYLCLIDAYLKTGNINAACGAILKSIFLYPLILPRLFKHGFGFLKGSLN